MHPDAYTSLAANEQQGWYYQARVRCVGRLIERYVAGDRGRLDILDVGCGTGGTSQSLRRFGRVTGIEPAAQAIELLKSRYPDLDVLQGSADQIGELLPPGSFDLATIMGVLYHRAVIEPANALAQVNGALRGGGWLIWNEGVHPILARAHDEFVESGRRFRPREMRALGRVAGLSGPRRGAPGSLGLSDCLVVVAGPAPQATAVFRADYSGHVSDDRPLPAIVNATLRELTYREWSCAQHGAKLPFGVSYLLIAQKVREADTPVVKRADSGCHAHAA